MRILRCLVALPPVVVLAAACGGGTGVYATGPIGADGGVADATVGQAGVGQPCSDSQPCRSGLACQAGTCAPGHSTADGGACVISAECKQGSYCSPAHLCAPAGSGAAGASCTSDGDCQSGLRCNVVGLAATCQPEGNVDVGGQCSVSGDCFGGIYCLGGVCAQGAPGQPPLLGTWKGVDCQDDPGPVTAYFRVPRGSGDGDFFRLPFPNDARRKADGHPDLTAFPTPGTVPLGYDAVDRYARYVEQSADGFSVYPTVTLRFSGGIDFDSLKQAGALKYVDVTPGGDGHGVSFGWSATTGRSPYVCENSVSVRPATGSPLEPGHTYAILFTHAVRASGGGSVARAPDLDALLAPAAPADAALAAAYTAYAPLRAWAASQSFDLSNVLTGTVFTVAHSTRLAEKLASVIAAGAAPTAASWVKCDTGVTSPCAQAAGTRGCQAANPAFDELHALVTLPIFQQGTAPYSLPADGGDIAVDGTGTPVVQRTEQVCLSLTVPKGVSMPAGGWPLVVYAHGTGGSFRSHVTEGLAARMATLADTSGATLHAAVLGIDQVEHGPRRGSSQESPDNLFFNFANPAAARGNPLQGAADQMSLVRFAKALDLAAGSSPTGAEIKFGPIAFWGHSQGATEGGIAMPYVVGATAAVLSGEGASLIDALLTKTSPVNVAKVLPFVLQDPNVGGSHPVLSLLQNAIDPADPLDHARAITSPASAPLAKSVFVPYGQLDTYAPPIVQATYVLAASLGLVSAPASVATPDPIGALTPQAPPASGNFASGQVSAFAREYAPSGYDGHFVAFQNADAKRNVDGFLGDALSAKVPVVVP